MQPDTEHEGRADASHCGAKLRQSDGHCRKQAGWGTTHLGVGRCRLHGGSTRTQTAGAERVRAENGARRILSDLGTAEPVDNPIEALRQLGGEILAFRDALRTMVERLGDGIRYEGRAGEQLRAEVVVYERALDRCSKILLEMARLNIDERLVALSERQGTLVAAAVRAILAGLDLTFEQQVKARVVVPRELRAMSQEAA